MDLDALRDEKELVSARIDEVEILMISARGKAVARLVAELDELEAKKEALKRQIAALDSAASRPKNAKQPLKSKAKGAPKKAPQKTVPPPTASATSADLEAEVRELQRSVEKREEEELKLRLELGRLRTELSAREAEVWESEQKLLKASMDQDPRVKHAVRLQRLVRSRKHNKLPAGEPKLTSVVKAYLKSEHAKHGRERWRLLVSLCSLQDSYSSALVIVREKYIAPMRKTNHTVTGASREDIRDMFEMIETLSVFEESLALSLRQRVFSRFHHPSIGDLIVRLSSVFPAYVEYARALEKSFAVMSRLQKGGLFGAYIEKLFAASGSNVSLTALMELPRGRVAQLVDLLGRLARLTDPGHCDASVLDGAVQNAEEAQRLLLSVEQERKEHLNLVAATRKIAGIPDAVLLPGQKLVLEQDVLLLLEKKRIPHRLFLFADSVVLASGAPNSKTFKFVEMLSLSGTRFNSLADQDSVCNSFELQTMSRVWQFVCDTREAKQRVEAAFAKTLIDLNSSSADLNRFSGHRSANSNFAGSSSFLLASLSSASTSSWFHLNGLRLESELRLAKSESSQTLTSLDEQLIKQCAALASVVESTDVLSRLDQESMFFATQLLDANERMTNALASAVKVLVKREPGQANFMKALADPDAVACNFSCLGGACLGGARPWIAALLSDPLMDVRKRKAPEEVAASILAGLEKAVRDLPLFIRWALATMRVASQKQLRLSGGPDASSVVFFGASFVIGPLKCPAKFGLSVTDVPASYLDALGSAFVAEATSAKSVLRSALVAAGSQAVTLTPTISLDRCRSQVLPSLVQHLQQRIELLPGEIIRPLAQCIVVLKTIG